MEPRDYVAESMEALSTGLEPFVKRAVAGHFTAGWLRCVRDCLPPTWSGVTVSGPIAVDLCGNHLKQPEASSRFAFLGPKTTPLIML